MDNVSNPIIIDQYYCDSPLPCPNQVCYMLKSCPIFLRFKLVPKYFLRIRTICILWIFDVQTWGVSIHSVSFVGIRGTSATKNAIRFACSDNFPCRKLFLKDVQLVSYLGLPTTSFCWKAYGSTSGRNNPPSCFKYMQQPTNYLSNLSHQSISIW